jgi:hypothetical protein
MSQCVLALRKANERTLRATATVAPIRCVERNEIHRNEDFDKRKRNYDRLLAAELNAPRRSERRSMQNRNRESKVTAIPLGERRVECVL